MGSDRCDLHLENYSDHFTGGQTIVGYAVCTFTSPKVVHGVILKIAGEATTHWTETETSYNSTTKKNESKTISYNGSHQLLNQEIDLLNSFGGETTIPQGVHKYPFTYRLPEDLPSSYHHNLGKIKYNIKIIVKRPFLKSNYEAESDFLIVTPVNLNNFSTFQNPQQRNKLKETYFCCWNKGNINAVANIPKGGFVLGEPLPLHIEVENLSQSNIEKIKVKIYSIMKFSVTSPSHETKTDKDMIYMDSYSGVGAHGENTYDKAILIDNATLLSNFVNSNVIHNSYEMEITFVISGMHSNIEFAMPLIIGHIPFGMVPSRVPSPTYNMRVAEVNGSIYQPPSYGFVPPPPQPAYNPNMPPPMGMGMPVPPSYGTNSGFGGYPPATAPTAPLLEATGPPKTTKDNDDWDFIDGSSSHDLPTYDQALKNQMKV